MGTGQLKLSKNKNAQLSRKLSGRCETLAYHVSENLAPDPWLSQNSKLVIRLLNRPELLFEQSFIARLI